MSRIIVAAAVLSATFLALPTQANAASNCRSVWTKASTKVQRFAGPMTKLVCKAINVDTPAGANKCVKQVEKLANKAQQMATEWNKEGGSWNIGARPLPHARAKTGAVATERQFVGQPVLNDAYTLTLTRTGGKAKKDLIVKMCFVDKNGDDVKYKSFRLRKGGPTKKTIKVTGVAGTFPLIHLNNERWGANAHKYTIKGTPSGEPPKLAKARRNAGKAASKPKAGMFSKKGKR